MKIVSDMYAVNIVDNAHKIRNGNITWQEGRTNLQAARQEIGKSWSAYVSTNIDAEERKLLTEATRLLNAADVSIEKLAEIMSREDEDGLREYIINELYQQVDPITAKVSQLIDLQVRIAHQEYEKSHNLYLTIRNIAVASILAGVLLAFMVSFLIVRSIIQPVQTLQRELDTLAERGGDLTQEIKIKSKDEIGLLADAVNKFISNLRLIMIKINGSAVKVSETALQLSATSQQTSAAASENASSISEISATIENVSSNIEEITSASKTASEYAGYGKAGIDNITAQMMNISQKTEESSKVIHGLNNKAAEIGHIVELITGIADQTNLLALNAAIEAARAGEQGRGFAVVAEEVRKLAEQSSGAAKEIKNLIGTIQVEALQAVSSMDAGNQQVKMGTSVVKEAGDNFDRIIGAVEGLAGQIQEVASATGQMSGGIQSVAASSQEQTASMEEVAASADTLSRLAEDLNDLVKQFKV